MAILLNGVYGFTSLVTNRLGQACSSAVKWMAPAAGSQYTTTAEVCILLACCVLFTQLASTEAFSPHTIHAIRARHAIKNRGIKSFMAMLLDMGLSVWHRVTSSNVCRQRLDLPNSRFLTLTLVPR